MTALVDLSLLGLRFRGLMDRDGSRCLAVLTCFTGHDVLDFVVAGILR